MKPLVASLASLLAKSVARASTALILVSLVTLAKQTHAAELRVAVASNFLMTLEKLADAFHYQTGHSLRISSGSTGKLYTQIRSGAPFDLFLSADAERPELLEREGRILENSRITYALGQLAFWSRTAGLDLSADALRAEPPARLALANARTAPYGRAAEQALTALELDGLASQRVRGENISQTFQLVYSGAAPVGVIAYSLVLAQNSGSHWLIPTESYEPIEQQMVIVKRTKQPQLARQFQRWMLNEGRALIIRDGYALDIPNG